MAKKTNDPMVQLLAPDGSLAPSERAEEFLPYFEQLTDDNIKRFFRDMSVIRRFDTEATNLQRQGQLALWIPSHGQEGAQVGSAHATRPQDHIFPAYREHAIAMIRGVDLFDLIRLLRGLTHGGWNPNDPRFRNFHLYTLVIGSQSLHATGYAMGIKFDGDYATGNYETDQAVIVYFGDGASSQGDVHEAMVFAASQQTPQVFFVQNNHWAISVPVSVQARVPLFRRADGYGMPGVQIDGNDVFASYAVTAKLMDDARQGRGPSMIEAETYRIGAHTSSDDPTKYRDDSELSSWIARDPITRLEAYLRDKGVEQAFFDEVAQEGADYSADIRHRIVAIENPDPASMFANVYSDPHPLMTEQAAWLANYEASFGEQESASRNVPTPTPDANSVQEAAPTAEGGDA
jgi:pyruvate dehydrogenase E1 component alpha subunit